MNARKTAHSAVSLYHPKVPTTEAFLELHTINSAVGCDYRDLTRLEVGRMPVTDDLLYLYYDFRQQGQQGRHNSSLDNVYEPTHVLTIDDDDYDWDNRVLKGTCVLVRHGSCAVTKLPMSWTTHNWRELAQRVRRRAVAEEKEKQRQQRSHAAPGGMRAAGEWNA